MAEIVGTTVTSKVAGGDKFRVTWQFWFSSVLPSWAYYEAPDIATQLREWLTGKGFIPVSMPSASPGDEIIVFDVRLALEWSNGRNVSDVLNDLEDTPWFWSLKVQRLQRLTGAETSTQLEQGQQEAIDQGSVIASTNAVFESAGSFTKSVAGALGKTAQVIALVAIAAIVVGAVYLYRESQK
jgi:hypothetical protein